ncbi:MAG: patatin-like phospholipase family protein [Woeseiaceae bacterium]
MLARYPGVLVTGVVLMLFSVRGASAVYPATTRSGAIASRRREIRTCICVLSALLALFVQGCASIPERTPLSEENYAESRVLGMSGLRHWGDEVLLLVDDLPDEPTLAEMQAALPGFVGREVRVLAISGGGADGAFAAGLLNGWSASGERPEFTVVTGISTGALIAPFAYLGPDYDHVIEGFYTQYSTKDLLEERGWIRLLLGGEAAFDTSRLRARIAGYIDESMMEAIAAEHRRGRYLLIGTTNLDAARPVIWDIGAIAESDKPGALDLIHDIILASASIPIAFPPVLIEVESGGKVYDEMHTDGGVSRQSFLFSLQAPEDSFRNLNIIGQGRAYLIRNSKLEIPWQPVDRKMVDIAGRSANSLVHTQGLGDLYREFIGAQKFDFDFNLAYIPSTFKAESREMFDRDYMRKLYTLAYELAVDGYPWAKIPPGLGP